jgi:hypothetical protein
LTILGPEVSLSRPMVVASIVGAILAVLGITAALRSPAPPPLLGESNRGQDNSGSAGGCLVLLVPAAAVGGFAWWVAPDKYTYAIEYDVNSDNVFVEKKPKDCDWDHAPVGGKGCHYKKTVAPQKNEKEKVISVYVSWERIED